MTAEDKKPNALDDHLQQWGQLAEKLRTLVPPSLKIQEQIQKSLSSFSNIQEDYEKALGPFLAQQTRWQELMESVKESYLAMPDFSFLAPQVSELQKSMLATISPAFEELQQSFRELPSRTQEALLLLGEHGWYLDLEMPLPGLWELKKALSDGSIDEAENELAGYFEGRVEEIEESVTQKFPRRAHLIKAAFKAHRSQEYDLSIPVLLAQADGICKEVVNQYLFIKQNKKPSTAIFVEQIATDTFRAALLSPLSRTLPINASKHERSAGVNALNRHAVLHGESLDYGNRINSLKAISLVNYVSQVLDVESGGSKHSAPGSSPEAARS